MILKYDDFIAMVGDATREEIDIKHAIEYFYKNKSLIKAGLRVLRTDEVIANENMEQIKKGSRLKRK